MGPPRFVAILAVLSIAAASGVANAEGRADVDRWVPGGSLWFDIVGMGIEGSTQLGTIVGPPLPAGCNDNGTLTGELCEDGFTTPVPKTLSIPANGSDTPISVLVGGSLELMTPRLIDRFFDPRLFVRGDGALTFAHERTASGFGKPDVFAVPEALVREEEAGNNTNVSEQIVSGQGHQLKFQVQSLSFGGGAGIAFEFRLFDRNIRLRPSFEYLRQEIEMKAAVHRVIRLENPVLPSEFGTKFRQVVLTAEKDDVLHAIGPGLEIEVDANRIGPVQLSVFGGARGYRYMGDTEYTLFAGNEFCNPADPANSECAIWNLDIDPWAWRGGVGIRFRWLPEE